ncbi:MAG: hypothetical protein JNM56_37375, partial [Planctomycetia bacterium]|nr:hypothetical protein [Planctomycetia bacterium]
MTATDWAVCADPTAMLTFLEGRASDRKLRLFACACCRAVWPLLKIADCRQAVETAERFADGLADEAELKAHAKAAEDAMPVFLDAHRAAAWSAVASALDAAIGASHEAALASAVITAERADAQARAAVASGATEESRKEAWGHYDSVLLAAFQVQRRQQADWLREIVGDPFVTPPRDDWPLTVCQLAEALQTGEDCAFALHDALLDMGRADLAEHFRPGGKHPPGC